MVTSPLYQIMRFSSEEEAQALTAPQSLQFSSAG
jgi:hypothetical protein